MGGGDAGGGAGSEARVSSSSGFWVHCGSQPSPLPPWVLLCWGQKPFSALLSRGLPPTRRVPEGKRAESQPRAMMGRAVQGPACCPHPLPSQGAALRPPHGQTPAGTSGQMGAQDAICPLSHHRPSQLPSQADTAGSGSEDSPASPCSPSPRLARIQPLLCPPQAPEQPVVQTHHTLEHSPSVRGRGLRHHLQ